jgi:hypothetical protein
VILRRSLGWPEALLCDRLAGQIGGSDVSHVQFAAVTSPTSPEPIRYKGEPLEPERGPGLGCFRFQLVVLAGAIILTPLSVVWRWPEWLSAGLLLAVVLLLLVAGQTIIFLLRLVAADRRSRRRPLRSGTRTVGELEDAAVANRAADDAAAAGDAASDQADDTAPGDVEDPSDSRGPVRQ